MNRKIIIAIIFILVAISGFLIYKKLNPINKELMKKELECIVSTQSLSKNTYEIVHKIL